MVFMAGSGGKKDGGYPSKSSLKKQDDDWQSLEVCFHKTLLYLSSFKVLLGVVWMQMIRSLLWKLFAFKQSSFVCNCTVQLFIRCADLCLSILNVKTVTKAVGIHLVYTHIGYVFILFYLLARYSIATSKLGTTFIHPSII